jgi:hypothetical protein
LPDWRSRFGAPLVPVATVHALEDDHAEHGEPQRYSAAHFEVRICDACGFTAWYARGLDALRTLGTRLSAQGREDVTLLAESTGST